ncbi:orotate phosphoribosyltransferase [Halopelagius inordinatus]|uniref:Orotate phosphoribosyltransferase n=1 Tax=Halopelagius inordinatus TaxID=553467 RepID=A0A1I2P0E1_9EURY|nr:phosphoribosyltransferase family protein [Halopelagius inordinatus]SFG08830.1 orotate phosphoribosyltransferase [Halopelagius inordinatus]
MNYRSVSQLNEDIRQLAQELPSDIDVVAAIPRSGLLAAELLCLRLDVPMTDINGLCEGTVYETGNRHDGSLALDDADTVLVIDDSVNSGTQMRETQQRLDEADLPFDIRYAAAYISAHGHEYVDYWSEVIEPPRVFEWNLMHHPILENACVDIDGILCRDPTREENDDGERYQEFLSRVEPRTIPNQKVGWLVTCRLEKYREETEAWLAKHGVEYDRLVMMDLPDKETRQELGNHAAYKTKVYESTGAELFIESSERQAAKICDETSKAVFCYDTNEMMQPGRLNYTYRKGSDYLSRLAENPAGFTARAGKYVLTRGYHGLKR